jgi:hypothetical protein
MESAAMFFPILDPSVIDEPAAIHAAAETLDDRPWLRLQLAPPVLVARELRRLVTPRGPVPAETETCYICGDRVDHLGGCACDSAFAP